MSSVSEWEETTLGAEADLLTGFPFKSERYTDSADSIPLVRGDNIVQGAMRWDGVKRWPLSERGEHELYELREGDVVLAMDRPWIEAGLKYAAISKHDLPCLLVQRTARLRGGPKLDIGFLRYLIGSLEFTQHIHAITTGTAVPHISGRQIKDFAFALPPLAEQKAIAAVLGALDDKIELNRRLNATLEAMARALFQSWFVNFDPVRAKLDGRPPAALDPTTAALDPTTAALFPDSFQDSEAGHIPKGWAIKPVGEVVDCVGGGTPSTAEPKYWEGGTHHWTTPKDFSSLQAPVLLDTDRKLTDAGIAKISSGLLPAGTLLLSSRAPVGYLAIAAMPVAINQGFIALKCNDRASNFFMLNWCQTNMAEIESRATGTTFAEISKQNFRPIRVVLPPKELMAAFTAKVAPLYAQITANLHQSRTLATLRDTLLPKLLSGELGVADTLSKSL